MGEGDFTTDFPSCLSLIHSGSVPNSPPMHLPARKRKKPVHRHFAAKRRSPSPEISFEPHKLRATPGKRTSLPQAPSERANHARRRFRPRLISGNHPGREQQPHCPLVTSLLLCDGLRRSFFYWREFCSSPPLYANTFWIF